MKAEKDTGNGKLWFDQSAGDIQFFNQRPEQIYGGVIMAKNTVMCTMIFRLSQSENYLTL